MKKLFGHTRPKSTKNNTSRDLTVHGDSREDLHIPTPIHQQFASNGPLLHQSAPQTTVHKSSADDERWEVVSTHGDPVQLPNPHATVLTPSRTSSVASLPPGASPPLSSPLAPRSPSPFSAMAGTPVISHKQNSNPRDRERDRLVSPQPPTSPPPNNIRKKVQPSTPVAAIGILRTLEPPRTDLLQVHARSQSEERQLISENGHPVIRDREYGEKKEKKAFWTRDKDKDKPSDRDKDKGREKDRNEDSQAELTRMIGYLTATASEDWALVLEVCDRASASDANAKEAVRALRREFKYGEPPAQLSAARLWAIMLRNSSELFISHSMARKFLDTLEDLLVSPRTSPVVRERLLDVVAAAAYASGSKKDVRSERDGFRGLWRRVKPSDKPDEGMPFDTDDAMFNPPLSPRHSQYDIPAVSLGDATHLTMDSAPAPQLPRKRKSSTRNRIIPLEEDMRRLFQECKIGQGNAALLSQALALSKPEDLKKKDVIKEFYAKSRSSQELILAQIPWAYAGAERSREAKKKSPSETRTRTFSNVSGYDRGNEPPTGLTVEEDLLAALLAANAELIEALKQYEDLERVALERQAEDRSRKETRMDRRHLPGADTYAGVDGNGPASRSPSPSLRSYSPSPSLAHSRLHLSSDIGLQPQGLAPPPAAPHGPRLPAQPSMHSRTPSPGTPMLDSHVMSSTQVSHLDDYHGHQFHTSHSQSYHFIDEDPDDYDTPAQPSSKALGKRKVVEPETPDPPFEGEDMYFDHNGGFPPEERNDSDQDSLDGQWHQPVKFVYDAAAERTQERIREGQALVVNGVH